MPSHTRTFGTQFFGAMAGGVNSAVDFQAWKYTTNNFAAIPARIRKKT
jgi:hypothetical protein